MQLSAKQAEIVESTDKYSYVIAGAGSGKTRTLTAKVMHLLESSRRGEKILAITFSNKAANELQDRLSSAFRKEKLDECIYVGTIHNFCMELLIERAGSIGLSSDIHIFEAAEDRLEIFKAAIDTVPQLKQKCMNDANPSRRIKEYFDSLSKAKRNFQFPADYSHRPLSQQLYKAYNDLMLAQNAIDFDDILLLSYRILVENQSIARIYQRIYKAICVDEAQDLNRAQYEVIKAIAGETSSIFMVGDPNQAIYGFNGSSSEYMCSLFPKEYEARQFVLYENYRSSRAVITAAQKIESSFRMEGQLPIVGECSIHNFDDEAAEAQWIIDQIKFLISNGHPDVEERPILLEQFAVLARTKYVFASIESALQEENISYHVRASANSGFSSESLIFKVFDLSLRLIDNKKDTLHLQELFGLLGCPKCSEKNFYTLWRSDTLKKRLSQSEFLFLDALWNILVTTSSAFHFEKCLSVIQSFCNTESNFTNDSERSLIYNDYLSWKERWQNYIKKSTVESRSLSDMLRSLALGIAAVEAQSGLTLSTIHMSKGLEFNVVFIMGMNEGVFPDYRALNDEAQLSEEQHNMFVSITRSKRLCYITFPQKRKMPWGDTKAQAASRYVVQLQAPT